MSASLRIGCRGLRPGARPLADALHEPAFTSRSISCIDIVSMPGSATRSAGARSAWAACLRWRGNLNTPRRGAVIGQIYPTWLPRTIMSLVKVDG